MIKIAICGAAGRMGRTIAGCIAKRDDCEVCGGIDSFIPDDLPYEVVKTPSELKIKPDVIIDFSNPASLDMLVEYGKATKTPVVFGTTGYSEEQTEKIKKTAEEIPVFFTFNMSLGINLLAQLAKKAASVLGEQFDIEIVEKHHNQKIDAPSGTAIMLANAINETSGNKYHYMYDRHSQRAKRDKYEIGMHSVRGGTIVGEHDIIFAGNDEVITLSHSAASKTVFAEGSVNAAVFMSSKTEPGLYDMSGLLF